MEIDYLSLKKINDMHAEEIQQAISQVLSCGWYLKGNATHEFENNFAKYIGTKYCIGCGNGLDALSLIFRAYKEMDIMHEGDEVIVPANTYIASILSITENKLRPVLVEPRIDSLQLDDSLIEQAITPSTKAILLVHLYGRCAYTERIGEICARHNLKLIEDNAQAQGTIYAERKLTGSLGDVSAHSFYPGKNLGAVGDAGAVTTNDDKLVEVVRALGNYGSSHKYIFKYKGKNSRIDEIQAAVLNVKLKYLDADNTRRKQIASYYYSHINNPAITLPNSSADSIFHIFPILCKDRDKLQQYLASKGIETLIHYPIPPHKQECYKEWNYLSLPVTELIHKQELSLPCNQTMTDEEAEYIADTVNNYT